MQDATSDGGGFFLTALQGLWWVIQHLGEGYYNIVYALTHPNLWLDWSDKQAIMRFVYYGGSVEFFFAARRGDQRGRGASWGGDARLHRPILESFVFY